MLSMVGWFASLLTTIGVVPHTNCEISGSTSGNTLLAVSVSRGRLAHAATEDAERRLTQTPTFVPVDGGTGRACRCTTSENNTCQPTQASSVQDVDACKTLCTSIVGCTGIEFKASSGRCEIWTNQIGASAAVSGYECFKYEWAPSLGMFLAIDGGFGRVCRCSREDDNACQPQRSQSAENLEACKSLCASTAGCTGIEFMASSRRCEVWTKTIGASQQASAYECHMYQPAKEFVPVDGGEGRVCRCTTSLDNTCQPTSTRSVGSLDSCKSLCTTTVGCTGVEFKASSGRCEVWTNAIGASKQSPGYDCYTYGQRTAGFVLVDGGEGRVCRCSDPTDNTCQPQLIQSAADLQACKSLCASSVGCTGIEFNVGSGRCEVWTNTIGASLAASGYVCFKYTIWAATFVPFDGGENRVCRCTSANDNSCQPQTIQAADNVGGCESLCRETLGCTGIEFQASSGRCEVWTQPIAASQERSGFDCFTYGVIIATTTTTTTPTTVQSSSYCGIAATVYQCQTEIADLILIDKAVGNTFAEMCMGYGGTHPASWEGYTDDDRDMCTLNINNDCFNWYQATPGNWQCNRSFGLSKNPNDCIGSEAPQYFFLWDEPHTQGFSAAWAAEQWKAHVDRWSAEVAALRARGTKVTSPLFTDSGGAAATKFQSFFDRCEQLGIGCSDPTSNYYIDVLLTNQWLIGDESGHAAQEEWIKDTMSVISSHWDNRLVILGNFAWLGATTADDQIHAITSSRIWDRNWSGLEAVFYFGAVDFGGGTENNALASVGSSGTTIGEALIRRCAVYQP